MITWNDVGPCKLRNLRRQVISETQEGLIFGSGLSRFAFSIAPYFSGGRSGSGSRAMKD
jgi:hypothetical protein